MRAEIRSSFGLQQVANVLRAEQCGQYVRQPTAVAFQTGKLRPASAPPTRSDRSGMHGAGRVPHRARPFRVKSCLDWERADAGYKAVRSFGFGPTAARLAHAWAQDLVYTHVTCRRLGSGHTPHG